MNPRVSVKRRSLRIIQHLKACLDNASMFRIELIDGSVFVKLDAQQVLEVRAIIKDAQKGKQ